jgi:hypothetical protein
MREHTFGLIDANNFYVSCERVFQPALQGKEAPSSPCQGFVLLRQLC